MKNSLSKSVAWYGLGNLFVRFLSFILLPIYSNLISTAEFGNYALLMAVYSIIAVLYQFGMHGALNKFYIKEKNEARKKIIFSSLLNIVFIVGIAATVILCLTANHISEIIFHSTDFTSLLILVFITLLVDTLCFYILHLLKTKEIARQAVIYSIIGAVLNFILNILLVVIYRMSITGIILSQLISSSFLLLIMLQVIRKDYVFRIDRSIAKGLLKFAYPLMFAGFLSAAVDFADRFILNYFFGAGEVGIYSLSYRIAMVMNVFVISFRTAWNPHSLNLFYSGNYKSSFGNILTKLTAISCLILVVFSLFAKYLFEINIFGYPLFNPVYQPGIVILPLVILGYIFSGMSSFYSVYPYVSNKTYHFMIADLLAFLVNIFINIILIPVWGIMGAAFATSAGFLSGAAYLFFVSRSKLKIDYQFKNLAIILISTLVFLFAGMNLKNIFVDIAAVLGYMLTLQFLVKINLAKLFRLNFSQG